MLCAMDSAFSFDVEPWGFVRVRIAGFLDQGSFAAFVSARDEAYRKLTCKPGEHLTLIDVSEAVLQTQDVVAMFRGLLAQPKLRSRRQAIVTGSSLVRMQVRRIISDRPDIGMFEDMDQAETWLRQPDARAA